MFDGIKRAFANEYRIQNRNMNLVFCDPASVVEVKVKLSGSNQNELCLFNGVQYSIIKSFETKRQVKHDALLNNARVDDADEQIEALVNAGLLVKIKDKDEYKLVDKFPLETYRNFAKQYTSAENIALRMLKEQDIEHAISCQIVRILKINRAGMSADEIVHYITESTRKYFYVKHEKIREQIRDLKIKKFIKVDYKNDKFVYAE
jgi:hypothetical protein